MADSFVLCATMRALGFCGSGSRISTPSASMNPKVLSVVRIVPSACRMTASLPAAVSETSSASFSVRRWFSSNRAAWLTASDTCAAIVATNPTSSGPNVRSADSTLITPIGLPSSLIGAATPLSVVGASDDWCGVRGRYRSHSSCPAEIPFTTIGSPRDRASPEIDRVRGTSRLSSTGSDDISTRSPSAYSNMMSTNSARSSLRISAMTKRSVSSRV